MKVVYWICCFVTVSMVIAYDDLSKQKIATQSTTATGPYDLYKAGNAVDRDITTCMRTNPIGTSPQIPEKTVWWKVDLGGVYNIYSVNIVFKSYNDEKSRQQGRFAGFSLYVSKDGQAEFLCYKDGPELPPLNITITCNRSGRYIKFFNERNPKETYPMGYELTAFTELCEVIVYGCYKDGVFGNNCNSPCPGNCKTNSCLILDGSCFECKPGWTGATCNKECDYGSYGVDCKQNCPGQCKNNVTCDHLTGLCDGGCAAGWNGSYCNTTCAVGWFGPYCKNQCSGHCAGSAVCNHVDGRCDGCAAGWYGSHCNTECDECLECNQQTGKCKEGYTTDKDNTTKGIIQPNMDSSESSSGSLVGGIVGAIITILIGVAIVLVLWFRRRSSADSKRDTHTNSTKEMKITMESHIKNGKTRNAKNENVNKSSDNHKNPKKSNPRINANVSVRNINVHIAEMSADDNAGFKDEYNSIERGELYPCSEAKKPENNAKNRYTGMYPYDHSRVILKNSQDGNDYINANYIENTKGKRCYIATQGPKTKTITDFWTMVWQAEVSTIVCLTNLKEGNKNKCVQYWPNINDKLQAGDITVRHEGEKTYAEHSVRRFKIYHNTKTQNRDVMMYHYTAWADRGVTDPLSLVVFHRQVMRATAQSTGKYTLVHCSAGIGRTGTYIALDVLYREGERIGEVNVPMYVKTMRKDRINMVQTEDQYKVLYLALMEAFSGPPKTMTTEMFISQHQGHNNGASIGDMTLSTEFEELLALRKEYTQEDFSSGRKNISANYTPSVLPVEHYMCSLSNPKGHKSYYNAVHIQTFLEKDCVISAQYPLPSYIEDFLRLIRDFNIQMVVFFGPIKDIKSSSTWFPTKNQSKLLGNFTLKHVSSTHTPNITNNKLILQSQEIGDMETTVLECPTWRDGQLTENTRILLDIIKEVKTEKNNQEGQILVLSSDGATSCGAFCVVYNALEQIKVDGEVDIFTIARQLQVRRPEFLSTWAEYQLCYAAVAEYLLNDFVNGN
uniref:protein-tyrosine-phosphatase n=1 Tax=Crassostrea virginica TaxID=6565 RepID=A0A8B8BK08_CRAVI|nr:receptor-type tyrosine-protein phosphatase alpha-like isoform X2 [Crassostrea virginica]